MYLFRWGSDSDEVKPNLLLDYFHRPSMVEWDGLLAFPAFFLFLNSFPLPVLILRIY